MSVLLHVCVPQIWHLYANNVTEFVLFGRNVLLCSKKKTTTIVAQNICTQYAFIQFIIVQYTVSVNRQQTNIMH